MRGLNYVIALLTGPSRAGSAERDLPGVGTFTYSGSASRDDCACHVGRDRPVNQCRGAIGRRQGDPNRPFELCFQSLAFLKSLDFSRQCFVPRVRRNNSQAPRNHFPFLAQISGNSRWLSPCQRNGGDRRHRNRRPSDADHQLLPRLRLHSGRSLDSRFVGSACSGRRHLLLQWLAGYNVGSPADGRGCQLSAARLPRNFR